MFKLFRIGLLLIILISVASTFLIQKNVNANWQGTLDIRIIPVVADEKPQTQSYVNKLTERQFDSIENFLVEQARNYDLKLEHGLSIKLEDSITDTPPLIPSPGASRLQVILWSLKLKWWAWQHELDDHHVAQIRLYVLYQSPNKNTALAHSTGLQNGLLGLVNARASTKQSALHQVIITHELLHIFGATDKYNFANGLPIYPAGYAKPEQSPLFPQRRAEIMGRSIAINERKAEVAAKLRQIVIGETTAREIGWLKVK